MRVLLSFAAVVALLLAVAPFEVHAMQLVVDETNRCRAYGNGSRYDISSVMDWPITFPEGADPSQRDSGFVLDPCHGYQCSDVADAACCQHADMILSCGDAGRAIWLLDTPEWRDYQTVMRVQFPYGSQWRFSTITFIEDDRYDTPVLEYIGEKPYLQYNFQVRGKCVGQELHKGEPCVY